LNIDTLNLNLPSISIESRCGMCSFSRSQLGLGLDSRMLNQVVSSHILLSDSANYGQFEYRETRAPKTALGSVNA
jgi:hypothetical protein